VDYFIGPPVMFSIYARVDGARCFHSISFNVKSYISYTQRGKITGNENKNIHTYSLRHLYANLVQSVSQSINQANSFLKCRMQMEGERWRRLVSLECALTISSVFSMRWNELAIWGERQSKWQWVLDRSVAHLWSDSERLLIIFILHKMVAEKKREKS